MMEVDDYNLDNHWNKSQNSIVSNILVIIVFRNFWQTVFFFYQSMFATFLYVICICLLTILSDLTTKINKNCMHRQKLKVPKWRWPKSLYCVCSMLDGWRGKVIFYGRWGITNLPNCQSIWQSVYLFIYLSF